MNYQAQPLSGFLSTIAGVAKSVVGWQQEVSAKGEYDAALANATAVDTASARIVGQEQEYAANRAAIQSEIDKEKQKQYIMYGAAVGIPVLVGLILMKKGK